MSIDNIIGIWISALIANIIVLYLFKKTYAYTLVERLLVGSATGYSLIVNMESLNTVGFKPLLAGKYDLIIAFVLFLLLWTRLIPKISWLSRYPTSYLIGIGLGVALSTSISGQIIGLSVSTIAGIVNAKNIYSMINAIIIFIGVISSSCYFIYTKEHTGWWGIFVRIGVLYMYVLFGLAFTGQYMASGMERTLIALEYMIKAPLRTLGIDI